MLNEILLHMLGLTTPIDIKYFSKEILITSIGNVRDLILMYLCTTRQTDSSIPKMNTSVNMNENIMKWGKKSKNKI